MHYVYVLYSFKKREIYTGYSKNLKQRIKQHLKGEVKSTKYKLPIELIYYEAYKDKRDATKREYFFKSGRGKELLKSLLIYSMPR